MKEPSDLIALFRSKGFLTLASLISEIIQTAPFLRLKGISYFGTGNFIYQFTPPFTRYDHSLQTVELLSIPLMANQFCETEMLPIIFYGLIHDIGHIIYSHTGELACCEVLGFNHEENRQKILSLPPISLIMKKFGITSDLLKITLKMHALLLESHLDCDTLSGITQLAKYFRLSCPDIQKLLQAYLHWQNHAWIWDSDTYPIIQQFWHLKHQIYHQYVYIPSNYICELLLTDYIRTHMPFDLNWTEDQFRAKNTPFFDLTKYPQYTFFQFPSTLTSSKNPEKMQQITSKLQELLQISHLKDARIFIFGTEKKNFKSLVWTPEMKSISWTDLEIILNKHYFKERFIIILIPFEQFKTIPDLKTKISVIFQNN